MSADAVRREPSPPFKALGVDAGSMLPAALAAIAESAVWFIPLRAVAVDSIGLTAGPAANYPLFIITFAAAAALATWLHRSPLLPSIVLGAGMVVGALQAAASSGRVGSVGVVASVVVMLVVAARVVTMSLRDWRNPVAEAFGIGATLLLVEVILTAQGHSVDRDLLSVMVAQFFLFSMASRAASIRLATPIGHVRGAGRRLKVAALAVVVLAGALGAGMALGGRGGLLQGLGRLVLAIILPVLGFLALVVARILLGPLNWIFGKLHIDLTPLQSLANSLQNRQSFDTTRGSPWVLRLIGLAVLILIALLLVRIVRRLWAPEEDDGREEERPEPAPLPVLQSRRRRRRWRGPGIELPADTVRRWYAEALLALDRKGIRKPPSWTPAEYLGQVRRALPECAPGFTALTRSYEEVRYGSRTYGRDALDRLDAHRLHMMAALKERERRDDPGQA